MSPHRSPLRLALVAALVFLALFGVLVAMAMTPATQAEPHRAGTCAVYVAGVDRSAEWCK